MATHSGRYYRVERRYSAFHRFTIYRLVRLTGKKGLNMISFPFQPSQGVQETISRAGTSFCGIPSKTDQEHLGKGFWLDRSESLSDDYEAVMQSIFLRFWSPGELVWSITSSLWSDFPPFHPSWLLFWSFRLGEHQQSIITRKKSFAKMKPTSSSQPRSWRKLPRSCDRFQKRSSSQCCW